MEVGVHQDRGLTEHLESTDVQTDVEVEREDLGQMTSTEFLEPADIAPSQANVVCHSSIADADTMVARGIEAEGSGVMSPLIIEGTDSGGGAGVERDLHQSRLPLELESSGLDASKTNLAGPFQV